MLVCVILLGCSRKVADKQVYNHWLETFLELLKQENHEKSSFSSFRWLPRVQEPSRKRHLSEVFSEIDFSIRRRSTGTLFHSKSRKYKFLKVVLLPSEIPMPFSFFEGSPLIEYHSKSDYSKDKKAAKSDGKSSFWQQIWSGELFDEFTGAAHLTKIDWVRFLEINYIWCNKLKKKNLFLSIDLNELKL